MCKNPRTTLNRDPSSRLYFMHCTACLSSRSVTNIKSGFVAMQRGGRKKLKWYWWICEGEKFLKNSNSI